MRIGVVLAGGASSQSSLSSGGWSGLHEQLTPGVLSDPAAMADAVIVAADSGLDLAERLGIVPTLVVGDLDSVTPEALERARARRIPIEQHPAAKDETDLELALRSVRDAGVDRVIVLGGDGGRLDHLLANIGAIASQVDVPVEAWMGTELVVVVDGHWSGDLPMGAVVSVLPWGGPVVVSETGVRWPLDHHRLSLGSTQGISNESLGEGAFGSPVEITVHEGRALVVVPSAKDLT